MASLRASTESAAAPAAAEGAEAASATLETLKEEGNTKFNAGDFSGAADAYSRCIDTCKKALATTPSSPSTKADGAPLSGAPQAGDSPEGPPGGHPTQEEVRAVLAAAYCNRSMCRLKQQLLQEAEADSRAALEIQPDYTKALYRHATACRLLGDVSGCVTDLRKLLTIDPKNKEGCRLLVEMKDHALEQQEQHILLPSTLLDIALDAAAETNKRVKAFRDLGRLVQERTALQKTLAREGLLTRLAVFLKSQNAAKTKAATAAVADAVEAGTGGEAAVAAAVAAPAAVEAAGWELLTSVVQQTPLGAPSDETASVNKAKEKLIFNINEPLVIPEQIDMCRKALRKVWTSEDFLFTIKRLMRAGVANYNNEAFTSIISGSSSSNGNSSNGGTSSSSGGVDDRMFRGMSCRFCLRVFGYLKQSEAETFEHDSSFLESVALGLDCQETLKIQLAALQSLCAAADARRRMGLKAKALTLRHGLERCLEAALALLSAAIDKTNCMGTSKEKETAKEVSAIERNVELMVVTLFSLLGDKERAEADRVDMQRLADQLLAPFLSSCYSSDPAKQSETLIGLKALLYLITADRDTAREFILQGTLLPYILKAATGEAAARAGLSGSQQQRQQQQVGTEVLLHCLDYLELRQKLLDDNGVEALLKLLRDDTRPNTHRAKLAVALARICVHSNSVREEVLERSNLASLLEDLLQQLLLQQQQQQQKQKGKQQQHHQQGLDDEFCQCVLELFFFLSLHAEFKVKLLETCKQQNKQTPENSGNNSGASMDLLTAVMEVGTRYCSATAINSSTNSRSSSKSSSLPRYLLCGGLCNLMKSRADKDRRPRAKGLRGAPDLDEAQLQELEAFYEKLPAEAKPVANGEIDAGDEQSILLLRDLLLQKGVARLLSKACLTKPLPSRNVLLAAGTAFCLLAKNEKARGKLIQDGALRALLCAIGALKGAPEEQRDLQQAAAQLCISINPSLFSYHEALDLVPALLPLLKDGHELLQYEGALALTNLTSVNEELRLRAFAGGAWAGFGDLMFCENDLLRAAGLEGWCNLSGCAKVQESIAARTQGSTEVQDLRLMLAFCLETNNPRAQQAAAGGLATLLNNSTIAKALPKYDNYGNLFQAIEEATEKQQDLLARLVACVYNVWAEELEGDEGNKTKKEIKVKIKNNSVKMQGLARDLATKILAGSEDEPRIVEIDDEA